MGSNIMKSSPQTTTRRHEGNDETVLHLHHPKMFRVIVRLVLLATAIMSFSLLCTIVKFDSLNATIEPKRTDKLFSLPEGIEKTSNDNEGEFEGGRRLLSSRRSKREALEGLEDAFLEQPRAEEKKVKKTKYLPDLMGENWFAECSRRVFVDVGTTKREANAEWFEREYPKKGREFEIVKVDLVEGEGGGIGEWMEKNVRVEEDFVVMKAEAEVVEEMVRENVIGLVDELFLECNNTWGKRKNRRAYWECLALYGRVRDEGVAVHLWWE